MAERNRYEQEERNRDNDWERDARHGRRMSGGYEEGRSPGGPREDRWESTGSPGGYGGRERGGYGAQGGGFAQWEERGEGPRAWQPGQSGPYGYGSHSGYQDVGNRSQRAEGDPDEGRFQYGRRGAAGWQGPEQGYGPEQSGYGARGDGGYGSPRGYGSHSYSYGPPEQHRGWEGPPRREAEGSSYGGYGPQGYAGYGTRGGNYAAVSGGRWMGEGYGGPSPEELEQNRYDFGRWGTISRAGRTPQQRWPKSYTRSDERIREDLYERILQHNYIDASDVSIAVSEGNVTLEGTVPERHMKHDIENIADECPGVKEIDNRIRVHARGSLFSHAAEPRGNTATGGATSYTGSTSTVAPSGSGKK